MTRTALCLFVASCAATSPVAERRPPNILDVPPVAAYVLPDGLDDFPATPTDRGILISEAEATRTLLARSELSARRVEARGLRAVLSVERASSAAQLSQALSRAHSAETTAQRWRTWAPWAVAAGVVLGAFSFRR
jgi:hypothetical protein